MMMNIYLTNLGKYNEGQLVGEWVELPVSEEELEKVMQRIGINAQYEEWFITDYETDVPGLEIGEYDNVEELNAQAEQLEDMGDYEAKAMSAMLEDGYSFDDAIENVQAGNYRIYSDCHDMTDIAYEVVEECGYLNNVPENVARYFDYEAFGRDLGIEGTFYFEDDDAVEIIK